MEKSVENIYRFLMELDKLKGVSRESYIFDLSRNENPAEHSWHLALDILTLREELNIDIDICKAIKMALVHDICEIGAGDVLCVMRVIAESCEDAVVPVCQGDDLVSVGQIINKGKTSYTAEDVIRYLLGPMFEQGLRPSM